MATRCSEAPRQLGRREFLKLGTIAGVLVSVARPAITSAAALFEEQRRRPLAWDGRSGAVRHRADGVAKVCGEKLFAMDMRSRDLPGWPREQGHAMLLRTTSADRVYQGIDLSALDGELAPDRVVTAEDLARDGLALPPFYGEHMLLPAGRTPAHLGHPVALLIWRDFVRFRLAKRRLRSAAGVVRYGEETGPLERDPWGAFRYVRVGGATPFDDDVYSSLAHSPVFPLGYRARQPEWPAARSGEPGGLGMAHAAEIARELAQPPADWLVVEREYVSPSTDTAALEADNANGWYDRARATLHLVVASQSPQEVAEESARLVARSRLRVTRLVLHPCYTVGYGSKDHTPFPYYGLIAALYGDGRPVRLANDRFEQFQSALKRHHFHMRYRLAIDRTSGAFRIFQADLTANGGGRANFSPSVALVAASAVQSIYYVPKSDVISRAVASRAVDAGSARGYGTLQVMAATEMLVDEVAETLGVDAIDLRLANVLRSGMKKTQGATAGGAMRAAEVLERSRAHPLWTERAARKAAYEAEHPGRRYGVGFACVHKGFGTGAEAAFAQVEVSPDGRSRLRHIAVEIGTGMTTAQALLCAPWLGRPADDVDTAVIDWSDLPLETRGDPWLISQADQDRWSANPRWTPFLATPTSASNSAYFYGHATREAARLIFVHGLWPAAIALWSEGPARGQLGPLAVRREDARWVDGRLTAGGLAPLPLATLARKAHDLGLVTGATVHTFNRWRWAEADFEIGGAVERLPIDALSLRHGSGRDTDRAAPSAAPSREAGGRSSNGYRVIERLRVRYPEARLNNAGSTYYSAAGTLVELAVERATGHVELLSHHSILECGTQIVPALVSGQLQGGLAMGIGHALYESLPLYEDGPGNGAWNFDRYHLPRASECAVWRQTGEVLPPLSATDPPKGMAEVVMIPVVAAIVNGIAHAIGHRFTTLPVTPHDIREVLA